MDAFVGLLGVAAMLAAIILLVVFAGQGRSGSKRGSGLLTGVAACLVAGIALVLIGARMYLSSDPTTAVVPQPDLPVAMLEQPPLAGSLSIAATAAVTSAVVAGIWVIWWLAFGVLPGFLKKRAG